MAIEEAARLHFGPSASDLVEGVNFDRLRKERAERMRTVLRSHGVPAILVAGSDNVRYLTGFWWSEFQLQVGYALFYADHPPVVFAPAGSLQQMPDQVPWVSEWRPAISWMGGVAPEAACKMQAEEFARGVLEELRTHGLEKEILAFSEIDSYGLAALADLGLEILPGIPLLMESSSIKTRDEIACLTMAASISVVGFESARLGIRPGVRQSKVSLDARRAMEDVGADNSVAKLLSGPLGFERGISGGDRFVEHGDLAFLLTCGTSYLGYSACLYRQFIVGRQPNGTEASWYSAAGDRLDAAIEATRPGASTVDVARELAPASNWGYASEAECFGVELGHGVGLVNAGSRAIHYNWPVITRAWSLEHPEEIQEGMVIALETIEGEHRVGGVRIEDMVVVTANGPRLITHYPRNDIRQV